MIKLHPLGTEIRYSLDMTCSLLYGYRPNSVRVCSDDAEMVQAAARRLGWLRGTITVDTPALAEVIKGFPGIRVEQGSDTEADAALILFAEPDHIFVPSTQYVVVVGFNAFSYKGLLHPGSIQGSAFGLERCLKQGYVIDQTVGMFTPVYLMRWSVSTLAGVRFPDLHFRLGQAALDRLFVRDWTWRIGSIVIMAGHRR